MIERERTYDLSDFADVVDIAHPLTERRIPVLHRQYGCSWNFHVALVIGGHPNGDAMALAPTDREVEQLCVYLEKHMRYYNDRYRRIVRERAPFDVDGTVNTVTFRKHPEHGWQYNKRTWAYGPHWFPTPPWQKAGPFTLEELLDLINTFGDTISETWRALKAESGAFGTTGG